MKKTAIILFFKYPEPGKVKKRLSVHTGAKAAADIYSRLAENIFYSAKKSRMPIFVFYSPQGSKGLFKKWLGKNNHYVPQKGKGLGVRMENAFRDVFNKGYKNVLIIGGDIQGITPDYFIKAGEMFEKYDTVIGPARDGGYYLIGFRKKTFLAAVFRRIAWSNPQVFEKTINVILSKGLRTAFLPAMSDIDTAEDLKKLYGKQGITTIAS